MKPPFEFRNMPVITMKSSNIDTDMLFKGKLFNPVQLFVTQQELNTPKRDKKIVDLCEMTN